MSIEDEKRIKFPEKHYVGFQNRKDHVHLGFMTPYGTDSAAKKRMETVDRWAKGGNRTYDYKLQKYIERDEIPPAIYDNGPLQGFMVANPVNHSSRWNSCRDKWRIEDPRGFELEITSGNLEKILERCTVVKGVIQEECIWARLDKDNILVPVDSDIYRNALSNTQRYASKVTMRDVSPGDKVELQNGEVYHYIGKFHLVDVDTDYYTSREERPSVVDVSVTPKKYHLFEEVGFDRKGHFRAIATPKVAAIHRGVIRLDLGKEEEYVNKGAKDVHSFIGYRHKGASVSPTVSFRIEKVENMTEEDAKKAGYNKGFVRTETGRLMMFKAHSNVAWELKDGKTTADEVMDDDVLTYVHPLRKKSGYIWSGYERQSFTIPLQSRFTCMRVAVDTGLSTIYVPI